MLTITIPSTGRPHRLADCLASIDYPADIKIGCRYPSDLPDEIGMADILYTEKSVIGVQNELALRSIQGSHLLPISDDIVFLPGAIKTAVDYLMDVFPDSNGIVGFNVDNLKSSPFCFMLIGSRFFDDVLHRELFFNGYKHFYADTELGETAVKMGKFYLCHDAKVIHHHPSAGAKKDETHLRGRLNKWESDNALYFSRVGK